MEQDWEQLERNDDVARVNETKLQARNGRKMRCRSKGCGLGEFSNRNGAGNRSGKRRAATYSLWLHCSAGTSFGCAGPAM
jgi:hypothetical protein